MAKHVHGKLDSKGVRFAIVAARFNEYVVSKLVDGALLAVQKTGGDEAAVMVYWVPGAFEIPSLARRVVDSGKIDLVICLGAVIRGATPHFDYVCAAAQSGVASLAAEGRVPVIFGVLTCDTMEQAIERAGGKAGNKGYEAALAGIEMVDLMKSAG
jgi:6,7-dimethyl-8-ribityllumazine synthase